jgi:hypothetical protein
MCQLVKQHGATSIVWPRVGGSRDQDHGAPNTCRHWHRVASDSPELDVPTDTERTGTTVQERQPVAIVQRHRTADDSPRPEMLPDEAPEKKHHPNYVKDAQHNWPTGKSRGAVVRTRGQCERRLLLLKCEAFDRGLDR